MAERQKEQQRSMQATLMTASTKRRLEKKLNELEKEFKKAQLSVGEASGESHNWHDNFPFEQAVRDVALYSAQVAVLRKKLESAQIVKPNRNTSEVQIGNKVILRFVAPQEMQTFTVLGPEDTDRVKGWLSYTSPLAQAILGKKVGESIKFKIPKGNQEVSIVEILPGEFE